MEYVYKDWAEFKRFGYKPRRYYREEYSPYIPTETEIDQMIAGTYKKYVLMLQLLKETGWRCGEIVRLTPEDFNLEHRIVTLDEPEKRSRLRQV